jgi:hypothetical protein
MTFDLLNIKIYSLLNNSSFKNNQKNYITQKQINELNRMNS